MNLFALVKAGTTLLGTDPVRFFEFGTAPALEITPYATWQEIHGSPFNYIEGTPTTDHIKTQIDVWAPTASECRDVARAVRRANNPPMEWAKTKPPRLSLRISRRRIYGWVVCFFSKPRRKVKAMWL